MAVPATPLASPAEPAHTFTPDDQLALRLFARVGDFRKAPPERALYRELLDLAISTTARFEVGGYPVSAAHVWATGAALYFRSNAAGIINDFSVKTLAGDARLGERAVRAALSLYRQWKVIRSTRPRGRRRAAEHRINLGGLDWPAVRKRAAVERAESAQPPLNFGTAESGHGDRTHAESGHGDRTESGHGDRTQGLRTELYDQKSRGLPQNLWAEWRIGSPSSDPQRARVLAAVKARRSAPAAGGRRPGRRLRARGVPALVVLLKEVWVG